MADITASDVTLTLQSQRREGTRKLHLYKIQFGNGTLTYPTGGVPLPARTAFGLPHSLDTLRLVDGDDGSGILWKYDQETNKVRGFIQGITVGAAGAVTVDDFPLDTTADPLATAVSLSLTNSTGAGTKLFGRMKELVGGTSAPSAQTLYAEAVGF